MKNLIFRFFKNFDWLLFASTILLCALGLAVLYSATTEYTLGSIAVKQTINMGIGIIALLLFSRLDYRLFKSYSGIMYLATILMLLAVPVFGFEVNEAQSWIDLGFFQFQPSVLALLFMIIILAKYFAEHYEDMGKIREIIKSGIYMAIPTALVALQPDFGTAFTFVFVWGVMILASNAKRIYLLVLGILGLASIPALWIFLADYQKDRLTTFLNPTADPMGAGWNVNQAMIAIGSGQMWGRGLGHGTQSQLNFIPEKETDFVFASLAEEMGFIGVTVLLTLFLVLFYRGIKIAVLARDFFGTYLAIGLLAMLFVHVIVNVGMNMGLMPVTGIPLPFISAGGTAIIVNLVAIGILESIYRRYKKIDF
ncbi:MAG: rod shape-determining protein RodA [Patescibacteria group bacterium]|nr:rod shape-determining protein RodA [Patescibacteria group bacterium]